MRWDQLMVFETTMDFGTSSDGPLAAATEGALEFVAKPIVYAKSRHALNVRLVCFTAAVPNHGAVHFRRNDVRLQQ